MSTSLALGPASLQVPKHLRAPWANAVAKRVVLGLLKSWARGQIAVVSGSGADGSAARPLPTKAGTPQRAPNRHTPVTVTVRDDAAYQAVLLEGSSGLARSYALGWWDTDDLAGLMQVGARCLPRPEAPASRVASLAGRARQLSGPAKQARAASKQSQVMAHYDLGDDFFASFLDPTMTYSCGIFEHPGASMEEASLAKLSYACQKLGLQEGMHVLEIGSGWGSFAIFAAEKYRCKVTTATLSPSQYAATKARTASAGLAGLVTVLECDYKELGGKYDKLVSIEMVEALGWRELDQFFAKCAKLLQPGGEMFLQAITIDDKAYEQAKKKQDFIKEIVFPGSHIPSVTALRRSAQRAGLSVAGCERIGPHYVKTLAAWRTKLLDNWGALTGRGYQNELLRLWDLYLAYCQAGFSVGRLDDVQMVLVKSPGGLTKNNQGQRVRAIAKKMR